MAKVIPHVYPILQNFNFDLVNPTCDANYIFFELKIHAWLFLFLTFFNSKNTQLASHVGLTKSKLRFCKMG